MSKNVIIYGAVLALVAIGLKLAEYRLLMVDHAVELYGGVVAAVFTVAGIVTARKFIKPKEIIVEVPVPVKIPVYEKADEKKLEQLGISKREYEILELIAQGLSNEEIASKMYLSIHTIKTHISNIFVKLDVKRRTQAIVKAREMGLVR